MLPEPLVSHHGRSVVLIDGGSGSGKSTLADWLADAWPRRLQIVRLDSFYPGWHGLAEASGMVARDVLRPGDPGFRRWDWEQGRPAEWVDLDPELDLVIEGCGALTAANRALATCGVWVRGNPTDRRRRALARDGATFASHWDAWAAQEREHWRAHRPARIADLVVDWDDRAPTWHNGPGVRPNPLPP